MKKLNATLSLITFVLASLTFSQATLAQQPPDRRAGQLDHLFDRIEDVTFRSSTCKSRNTGTGSLDISKVPYSQGQFKAR